LRQSGLEVHCINSMMKTLDDRDELARAVLSLVAKASTSQIAP